MPEILRKKQRQLFGGVGGQGSHPGVGFAPGKQGRLPAHQGGEPAQGVHQPVAEHIRPGRCENPTIIRRRQVHGVFLFHGGGEPVLQSRQGRPGAFVQAHPAQAVQNPPLRRQQIQVAGSAHQLRHQLFLNRVAHFIGTGKGKFRHPLHRHLVHRRQAGSRKVLAQHHAEHGGLRRIFRGAGGEMEPGGGRVRGDQQLFPALPAPNQQQHRVPAGLENLFHPAAQAFLLHLRQNGGEKKRVKGHQSSPSIMA